MGWFFGQAINEALQNFLPEWLVAIFQGITFLGDPIVYIVILAVGFWIYKKKEAIIAMYVLLTSVFLNFFLKTLIQKPRPTESIRIIEEDGYSTPSGHAQNSTAVYGWIMLYFKKIWLYIVTPILVLLICLSRVVLGVHYIGDVIIGFLVGAVILVALYFIMPYILKWMENWSDRRKIIVGEAYGVAVFIITFTQGLFGNWDPEHATNPVLVDNTAQIVSALILIPVLVWVESKFVKMKNENIDWSSKILRVIVGLVVLIGAYFGFVLLFDLINTTGLAFMAKYSVDYLLRFIRYSILMVLAILLLPLLFTRVKFFSKEKEIVPTIKPTKESAKT
ncbi:MAG: phosphatase PAP2 family protein [Candidatus Heimdallarchaeota archaeon]|nr:MAG: phosphatase PAP2 family protein [Candidatus Heimdallarchaeota archaeon]